MSDYSHVAVCHTSHEAGITPLSEMRNAFCGSVVGHHPQQLSHTVPGGGNKRDANLALVIDLSR